MEFKKQTKETLNAIVFFTNNTK